MKKNSPGKSGDRRIELGVKNRGHLLDAAERIFQETPYDEVTIKAIVDRAGLGVGTFYNHFSDKESLFRELLDIKREKSLARQHRIRESAENFPDLIYKHFEVFFNEVSRDPSYFELFKRNADVVRRITSSPSHIKGLESLRQDIDAAVKKGLIGPVDADLLAAAMMGIALETGSVMVRRSTHDTEPYIDFATRLVLGTIDWTTTG